MTPSKIDMIGLMALMVAAASAYLGFFRGSLEEQAELEQQAMRLETLTATQQNLLKETDLGQETLVPLRETLTKALGLLADPDEVDQFLGKLAAVAGKVSVDIRLLQPSPVRTEDAERFLPVRIEAVATFPRIYRFLAELEGFEWIATIEKLTITNNTRGNGCEARVLLHLHLPPDGKQG